MTDSEPAETADLTLTPDDIDTLNSGAILRAAAFARIAGAVVIVAGAIGLGAWLWAVVRGQQNIDEMYAGFGERSEDASFVDRVDVFVREIAYLLFATMTIGLGIGLRVLADYAVAQTGGSLTGFVEGDTIPDDASPDGV